MAQRERGRVPYGRTTVRRARPASTRAPKRQGFLRRSFWPPTALGSVVFATIIAVVVAFVSTLIFAEIDSNRPLVDEPVTVAPGPVDVVTVPPESEMTSTTISEVLSADELAKRLSESVWLVKTRDEAGRAVEGTAFVVGSFGGQTLLLTSLTIVRSSTRSPSPPITVERGTQATTANLWTWEEGRDFALLVIGRTGEPKLPWVGSPGAQQGEKVFAAGAGRNPAPGTILGVSNAGVEHNVVIEPPVQGAPLVNEKGQVVAMASILYNPGNRGTQAVFTGVPISLACERVLRCGGGNTAPSETTTTTAR